VTVSHSDSQKYIMRG